MSAPRTAIVVGGGPAGLIAACHLQSAGTRVTLLESSGGLGGRAVSVVRDGFVLNQGAHALYAGGPALRELKRLGIDPPRWNPTSHRSVFVRGEARRLPGGSLGWLPRALRAKPAELTGVSTAAWLDEIAGADGPARAAAAANVRVTTFTADHESLSADVAATQLRHGLVKGVRYVRGGWQWLVDALAAEATRRGVEVRTRAGVRALEPGWSVHLDDETLHADVVVLATGGPAAAAKLLGDRAPVAPGPAVEVSALDIGLERLPRRDRTFALGVDTSIYASKHSPKGFPGGVLLSLVGYGRESRTDLEAFADTVHPGWRDLVKTDRFLPRQDAVAAAATPATGGMAGRPAVDRGDGLFLAGDWVGPDGWLLDAAAASAVAAARAAVAHRVPAPA